MNGRTSSKEYFAIELFKKYWISLRYVREGYPNFTLHFICISFLFLLIASIGAYTPFLLREAANEVGKKSGEGHAFYAYALAYAVCWTLENVLENIKGIFSAGMLARSDAALNKAILSRIFMYPYTRQMKISPGAVAQDINRASNSFSAITTSAFWTISPIVFGFFVSISIIWDSIGSGFALLFGVCVVVLAYLSYFIASKTGQVHSTIFLAQNQLQGYIVERLAALLDIRLNAAQKKEGDLTDSHLKNMVGAIWSANLRMGCYLGLQAMAIGLVLGVFTIYSAQLDSKRSFTSGDFAMIAGYVGMLTMQLRFLSGSLIDLKRNEVALQSGLKYLDFEFIDAGAAPLRQKDKARDFFSLKEVVLAIDGNPKLPPISYIFKENEFTVISAPSGAGKTTLINTMLGLLPPSTGSIEFRGIPVNCNLSSYILDSVAVAPQASQIFNASLRFNLTYGSSHFVSDTELIELLDAFEYPELRTKKPEEILGEFVGPNGRLLSGGERQRVSIARALLRGKDAVILDEPTASLNKELANKIIRFISARIGTLVVITHDPDIARMAQNELVLPTLTAGASQLSD